jgi:hypothetical protein
MSSIESAMATHLPSHLVGPLSPILPDGQVIEPLPSVS